MRAPPQIPFRRGRVRNQKQQQETEKQQTKWGEPIKQKQQEKEKYYNNIRHEAMERGNYYKKS